MYDWHGEADPIKSRYLLFIVHQTILMNHHLIKIAKEVKMKNFKNLFKDPPTLMSSLHKQTSNLPPHKAVPVYPSLKARSCM